MGHFVTAPRIKTQKPVEVWFLRLPLRSLVSFPHVNIDAAVYTTSASSAKKTTSTSLLVVFATRGPRITASDDLRPLV